MTSGHLSASQLAEHAEGLHGPDEAAAVNAHLRDCEACRATAADLKSVSAMLAAAPPTLPTPPHVVARLDRALAEEAAPTAEPARVIQLSWFRRRAPQLLAAAATVGILGFAGWVVSTGAGGDEAGDDSSGEASVAESAEQDETSGDAGAADSDLGTDQEAAETAPLEAEDGEYSVPVNELEDEIRAVVEQRRSAEGAGAEANACGTQLADELAVELVGSAPTNVTGEPAVLVVVSDDAQSAHGWVLPACDASIDEAFAELTVELD